MASRNRKINRQIHERTQPTIEKHNFIKNNIAESQFSPSLLSADAGPIILPTFRRPPAAGFFLIIWFNKIFKKDFLRMIFNKIF